MMNDNHERLIDFLAIRCFHQSVFIENKKELNLVLFSLEFDRYTGQCTLALRQWIQYLHV